MILSLIAALSLGGATQTASSGDARHALSCAYAPRDGEVLQHPDCAWRDAAGLHVRPIHLRRLAYDRDGLAAIFIGGWYYVRPDGRFAPTLTYDNWADSFHEGRARTPVGNKIGFIDQRLNLMIPARFDGAYPFDHGLAVVCLGCVARSDGEHSWYEGGVWGCIDRLGRNQSRFRPLKPGEAFACRDMRGR